MAGHMALREYGWDSNCLTVVVMEHCWISSHRCVIFEEAGCLENRTPPCLQSYL